MASRNRLVLILYLVHNLRSGGPLPWSARAHHG